MDVLGPWRNIEAVLRRCGDCFMDAHEICIIISTLTRLAVVEP